MGHVLMHLVLDGARCEEALLGHGEHTRDGRYPGTEIAALSRWLGLVLCAKSSPHFAG